MPRDLDDEAEDELIPLVDEDGEETGRYRERSSRKIISLFDSYDDD